MLVSWNTTRQCNLACKHCYRDAGTKDPEELTLEEGKVLLEEIVLSGFKAIIFSGGEPLLREDIYQLIAYVRDLGLRPLLGTNGTLIDSNVAKRLKDAGLKRAGISLDSLDIKKHDEFRGVKGAWEASVNGMEECKRVGLEFQIHTTLTERNRDEIEDIADFAQRRGAKAYHIFFLVPTGRGEDLEEESLKAKEYEGVLNRVLDKAQEVDIGIKATCAPQIMRIAQQRGISMPYHRGCLAGISYCVIIPNGDVQPCPYLPLKVGNVRERPFSRIWEESEVFHQLRSMDLKGKCGSCRYKKICGGCRARAYYYSNGDYMAQEPWCLYNEKR